MPASFPSRRQFLQSALVASAALAPPQSPAQTLAAQAYEVSPWAGPVAGFSRVDTNGRTWQPADFKGRPVLLNFWASWCEPCRAEMPSLQQAAARHGADRLLVLAINFKESPERALQFVHQTGLTLPVLLDVDGQAAKGWGVRLFPTTLSIDRQGRPRHRVRGEMDWTGPAAEQLIASLL